MGLFTRSEFSVSESEAEDHIMKHNKWLIDANILIGAKNNDKYCTRVLRYAKESALELLTTREVYKEVNGDVPESIDVITLPPEFDVSSIEFDNETMSYKMPSPTVGMAFNSSAMMASIRKQFGGKSGKRKKPSQADESLILAYNAFQDISGIISNDLKDLEFIYYNSDHARPALNLKSAQSFVEDGLP